MQSSESLSDFLSTPFAQEAMARHERQQAEHRQSLRDEIVAIKARRGDELRPLEAEATTAKAEVERTRQALDQAEQLARQIEAKIYQVKQHADGKVRRLERELVKSAPAELDEFIAEMRGEIDDLRARGISHDETRTNRPSVEARLAACRKAISEAERLKLHVVDDLSDRLGWLRRELPAIIMQKIEG